MVPVDANEGSAIDRDALRSLARRPLTEHELRDRLAKLDHPIDAIDESCRRLREAGYLDDARLAVDFVVLRAERLRHGPVRLVEQLCRRGVAREVAEAAIRSAVESGELVPRDLLRRGIERKLRGGASLGNPREYARVYNALRRAGFDEEAIHREMESYRRDEPRTDSFDGRDDP